ncbi:adhesion G-protein coupled receptor D1 [Nematostella vectensis]|uniref:adhesion G-protein coupled receptor D1 n=1 Tax=Nematostella vectensis TaxID=45351 RepID=UPI002077006B|nr:adhesion G-protein coupled receptor D1 [Nematostella vectensis]
MNQLLHELRGLEVGPSLLEASRVLETFAMEYAVLREGITHIEIARPQLVLQVVLFSKSEADFVFPPSVTSAARITIPRQNIAPEGSNIVTIVYENMESLVTSRNFTSRASSKIIVASMKPVAKQLTRNITLNFVTNKRPASATSATRLCVFWDFSIKPNGDWSSGGCSLVSVATSSDVTCSCNHLTHFAVLMRTRDQKVSQDHDDTLQIITYIGLSMSILGCLLTSIAHYVLTDVSSEQSQIRINLSLTLALAHACFLLGTFARSYWAACVLVAALLQFFYLCFMCWMLAEGIQLYLQIVKVFNTNIKLKRAYVFAWGAPLLIVITSLCISETAKGGLRSYVTQDFCWMSFENDLVWAFIVPVLLIILCNVSVLVRVVLEMIKVNKKQNGTDKSPRMASVRHSVKAFVLLAPLLGVTWLTGLLGIMGGGVTSLYIFTILNSFQGFFIFLFHCLKNSEIRNRLKRKIEVMEHMHFNSNNVRSIHINKAGKATSGRVTSPKLTEAAM